MDFGGILLLLPGRLGSLLPFLRLFWKTDFALGEINSSREKGDGEGEYQQSAMFVVTGLAGTTDGTSRGRVVSNRGILRLF